MFLSDITTSFLLTRASSGFGGSCKKVHLSGTILTAICDNGKGVYDDTSIDISKCAL